MRVSVKRGSTVFIYIYIYIYIFIYCVQITIEDAQAQQWISEIHPDVQLVSNMDSLSFFVRVCVLLNLNFSMAAQEHEHEPV